MNQVIRKGAFETNSSSTHSIVISNEDFVADKLHPNEDGFVDIWTGEFGWAVADYNDAASKASYCLTHAVQCAGSKWRNGMGKLNGDPFFCEKDIKKMTDSLIVEKMIKRLASVIRTECDGEPRFFGESGSIVDDWGYIDHQSDYVCAEAFKTDESLHNFIFNPKSTLHTDNDNRW